MGSWVGYVSSVSACPAASGLQIGFTAWVLTCRGWPGLRAVRAAPDDILRRSNRDEAATAPAGRTPLGLTWPAVFVEQVTGYRTRTISLGICAVRAAMPPDLRDGVSASDRVRPFVAGVNDTLMGRRTLVRPAPIAVPCSPLSPVLGRDSVIEYLTG
jgi:hypothetical protein